MLDLDVPPDGAVVVGRNGHGKTNLLEAVYYLVLFRSFRGAQDREAVEFGSSGFFLSGEVDARANETPSGHVTAGYETATGRKRVTVDGAEVDRFSDAIGRMRAVIITPDDRELVVGSPGARRRYLDIVLSLTCHGYLEALRSYRHALRQRNAALRRLRGDEAAAFESALGTWGRVLIERRRMWTASVTEPFGALATAMGECGDARLRYHANDDALDFSAVRDRDLQRGTTTIGPHRDDLVITLDGRRLQAVGSAGQQRTAAMALRLLEADALGNPVLLLDDIFAELDDERRERLAVLLDGRQRILAVPRDAGIPEAARDLCRWDINRGEITG